MASISHAKGVTLENLSLRYGAFLAVDDVSLKIEPGEFVSLLGPSGCGKTTTLRMIAGFLNPTGGRILIAGREITAVPARERGVGFVFQNYALWPHMTVAENVAFGLKMRRADASTIREKVENALKMTSMLGLADRFPRQLSGGQQQRVAIARAYALDPPVLLMDEPLSNLDRKLRIEMRRELKLFQQRLGMTTIFVTHDQEEALSMSDRVAVMDRGRVLRAGAPSEIYDDPQSEFIANFIGDVNLLDGRIVEVGQEHGVFETASGEQFEVGRNCGDAGDSVRLMIRPEHIVLGPAASGAVLSGTVSLIEYFGSSIRYLVEIGDGRHLLVNAANGRTRQVVGDRVAIRPLREHVSVAR